MKKFLSVLLAVMMVVTILPVNLLAMPVELEEHSHSEPAAEAGIQADAEPLAGEWYDRIFIRMNSNGYQLQPSEFRGIIHIEHTQDTSSGGTSKKDEYTHNVGQQYQSGKEVIFTAIPDAGYRFDGWYKNDADGELIQTGETWRFISNNENAAYTHYAKFSKDESVTLHQISFIGDPAGLRVRNVNMTKTSGVTFPNGYDYLKFDVEPGWDMSFSIEMGRDYVKTDDFRVVCNGTELVATDGVYTLSNINESKRIEVLGFSKVKSTTVSINKIKDTMQDRDNVVISGTVKDESGKAVTTGTLEVLVDGKAIQNQPTLQSDGSFSVELSGITGGSHKATVKYSGGEQYKSSEAEADFFVEAKEHFIKVKSNGYSMDENKFIGTVRMQYTVDDGNGKAQKMVEYGIDFGRLFPIGQGILLTAIPAAGYKFGGWYKNNENGDLLSPKEEWNINANSIYAAYTHYAKFVRDDSKTTYAVTFADGLERMTIRGFTVTKTSGTVLPDDFSAPNYTVEAGWSVSFSIDASEGYIKNKDYKVLCNGVELTAADGVYTVSDINENKEIRVYGIVDKTAPIVTINDIPTVKQGENIIVSGTVKDADGTPVTEGTVQVYIDDVAKGWPAVALAADGSFTCEIPGTGIEAGEHEATARYFAEKTYVDSTASKKFTVVAGHAHCVCGGDMTVGDHTAHSAVVFSPWNGGEITYNNNAAYIYIPENTTVTLENDIVVGRGQTLYLCLNDKTSTLASNGSAHFIINGAGARLVICSCGSEQGAFKGRTDGAGNGGCIEIREGNLDIYGGRIGYANAKNGGAIYTYSYQQSESIMNIYGGSICGSTAVNGGGLYMAHSEANGEFVPMVYMRGGAIEDNKATENGGGVYIEGDKSEWFGIRMSGGTIRKNNAAGNGGGIYSHFGRDIFITDGEISENTAANGGGIYLNKYNPSRIRGLLEMSGGKITGNTATENGGGIYAINVNFGSGSTGAIGFRNVEISGNKAKNGGGIYAEADTYGDIIDSVIKNNRATESGGGIYLKINDLPLFIRGTTKITNNAASAGGGIAVFDIGKIELKDSAEVSYNTIISGSGAAQILVDGNDRTTFIMNGGSVIGPMINAYYGIELKNRAAFTVNAGTIDVYGIHNGINNEGTFTVNGGVVEALAASGGSSNRAYSRKPEVSDTMLARHGDSKEGAKDVDLSKVVWMSKYIYLGTGYRAAIEYFPLGGMLPEGAPEAHVFGTKTVLPIPTRDGYNFDGWYEDTECTKGPVAEIGADITGTGDLSFKFYAKWTEISEWNEPTYDWTETESGYDCTATRTHKTDPGKVETETVTATYNEVSAPTCDYDGYGVYLATFTNTAFKEQIKRITLPKGHVWETPRYNWTQTATGYNCTATRICYRNMSHVDTETVAAVLVAGTPATCTEGGTGKYTATFTKSEFREQTREFNSPATGHDWAEPTYDWNQTSNGYNCTAKRICNNDSKHIERETATATYAEITPATEEADGHGRYTATFENAAFTEQRKDVTLPKIVHDWSDGITYRWEGEYCIASRTCKNHGETETETVKGTYSVEIEPGCTTPGRGKYVAHFTNPVFVTLYGSPVKSITLPAAGHDWDAPSISWRKEADGSYTCDAVHYCKRNKAHFEAASTRATYEVITKPTCERDGLGRYTAVFALADFETQTKDETIPKLNHNWNAPTYDWKEVEGGYECTAKRVCKNDANHVETDKATVTYAEITPATCLANGEGRYTAEFSAAWAETQTKDVVLNAFGHDWGEPTYRWNKNNDSYMVNAESICNREGCTYIRISVALAEYKVITPATCTEDGLGRYTAVFEHEWAETQTKDVVLNAFGHDWNEPEYEWTAANGGYSVTAKRVCKNDASHVETETVNATYAVVTEPKCLTEGSGRYTATFTVDWAETQTKDIVLNALGHDWAATTYKWTEVEGGYSVTAKRVCSRDASHVETETVKATYAVVTEPKCLTDGTGRYTATFTVDWAKTQTKDIVLNALGHDWAATTYDWKEVEGGYSVTAMRVCNRDASHVETETVKATYAVVTEPKCLTDGTGRYTATFTVDWAKTQTKDIVLKALGHDHSGKWIYNREDHWKKCTRCGEVLDLHEHDFTDWTFEYKSKTEKYRDCKVCGYHQEASVINIGGNTVIKPNTEHNPNTGAELFTSVKAVIGQNRIDTTA